jgi:succinate dehydrogenase flavin-adding protein (antitoxin of CptAB toxin-antitoxin module)
MSDDQLAQFEKLIDANDDQGALKWLEANRPNYREVVGEELEKLKQEVTASRDQILGA